MRTSILLAVGVTFALAGPAAARQFDKPMDELGPFKFGQQMAEIQRGWPKAVEAPHLDDEKEGTKALVIRETVILGMPMRSVALHFRNDVLVRILCSVKAEVNEERIKATLANRYGDPGARDGGGYTWEGKDGTIRMHTSGDYWLIALRPGPKWSRPGGAEPPPLPPPPPPAGGKGPVGPARTKTPNG